jgi:hypothetical protein
LYTLSAAKITAGMNRPQKLHETDVPKLEAHQKSRVSGIMTLITMQKTIRRKFNTSFIIKNVTDINENASISVSKLKRQQVLKRYHSSVIIIVVISANSRANIATT